MPALVVKENDNAAMKILFPEEIYKLESGAQVGIRPVPFGKFNIFSSAIAALWGKISKVGDVADINSWPALFDVAFEELISIMRLILDKDRSFFDGVTIEDGINIIEIIVRQNLTEGVKKKLLAAFKMMSTMKPM